MTGRIAVVGGGWAGCTAALTLAEAGRQVILHEAAPQLGGRARSITLSGQTLDNGQHILLGAYARTLDLIARVNDTAEAAQLTRLPLTLDVPPDFHLACPAWPAPLHLAAGLLGAHGLSWRDKLAAIIGARRLLGKVLLPSTVAEALADQPAKVRKLLWTPLCEAALNTLPDQACAATFRAVLQGAFGGRRSDSDLLLPRQALGALFPEPAAHRIAALGGEVRTRHRVTHLVATSDSVSLDDEPFDAVIIATAPWHAAPLLSSIQPDLAHTLATYATTAIATGYLRYPASIRLSYPMLGLSDGPGQYAFDRGASHGQPGMIAVVASAADALIGAPHAAWLARMADQLAPLVHARPLEMQGVLEKRATWACVPGLPRPPVTTTHPRVFLAGDYTAGPYPATLESACTAGVQSARALLTRLP